MHSLIVDFIKEFHKNPLFTVFVAFALMTLAGYSMVEFARADDVDDLRNEIASIKVDVCGINLKLERDKLEDRIFDLEREIFSLELLQKDGSIQPEQLDRLGNLRSRLSRAERDMSRIPVHCN